MRSFTPTTLWLLQKKKKYIGSVQEWQRTTCVTADGCRIYLVSGQSGGKRKNLVWKKKYCEVLLGNPLIWDTDRGKCATRFIGSPKNCLCSTQGNLFWVCYFATANSFALWACSSSCSFIGQEQGRVDSLNLLSQEKIFSPAIPHVVNEAAYGNEPKPIQIREE